MGATSDAIYDALTADTNAGFVSPLTEDASKKIRAWCDAIALEIDSGGTSPGGAAAWACETFTTPTTVFALARTPIGASMMVFRGGAREFGWTRLANVLTLDYAIEGDDTLTVQYQYLVVTP
jgi:hypothetical protein